jgi:adenylosuccinate lyase
MIDRYSHSEIQKIWSDLYKYQLWANIEIRYLNVLRRDVLHSLGCLSNITITFKKYKEIKNIELVTKHDVAALVKWLEKKLFENLKTRKISRFVHYGLTSSDIVDSAFSCQILETNRIISRDAQNLINALRSLSRKYENLKILGRTHGQAAEEYEFPNKILRMAAAIENFIPKIEGAGKISGSLGNYRHVAQGIEARTLMPFNLSEGTHYKEGQIIHRAYYAKVMTQWCLLACVLEKIAFDFWLLAQTGIEEIGEGFDKGQVGSSSMPHKRNPIGLENIRGLVRVIRGYTLTALENVALANERDISHSSAERIIFPDAAVLLGYLINRLIKIVEELYVNKKQIDINLEKVRNKINSQERMLNLIDKGISRIKATELINTNIR